MYLWLTLVLLFQTPTLEDALQWLKESLPSKAGHTGKIDIAGVNQRVTEADFDRCACSLTVESEMNSLDPQIAIKSVTTLVYAVPLGQLNAAEISIAPDPDAPALLRLKIAAKGDEKPIKLEITKRVTRRAPAFNKGFVGSLWLPMPDKPTAERFQKAFAHAITLCQSAKKEPF